MENFIKAIGGKQQLIKYAIYALIGILVIVLVVVILKKTSKTFANAMTQKQQDYINSLEIDEGQVGLPTTQINTLVAKLKTAFGMWGAATDEDAVYDVFETINTRSELLKIISVFGVHKDHTLNEWMTKELNQKELEHVQEILESKGIVYTF